jgi:anaerobic selenocysteine-containing dehydrogenase
VLPIRGHSNVQGIGTVGVTPKLKDAIFERLQDHYGVQLPTKLGYDTMAGVEAAARGELRFAFCLGGNLFGSNPDAAFAQRAMGKTDLVVYLNTTLNTGHAHGLGRETIILPVLARDEEPEPTTQESMFSFVRLSDGGPRRHEGPRGEIEIIAELAERTMPAGGPVNWEQMQSASRIRDAISKIVPGLQKIGEIDRTKQEFAIPGRAFHTPAFATKDGKARMHVHDLPELAASARAMSNNSPLTPHHSLSLRLMTIRSEGQFNTVVYEDHDLYRGVERRDVILLHPDDIAALGLTTGQRVRVISDIGEISGVAVHAFADIRAGNAAMYYPEANALVPRTVDPLSKTPAFKCVVATVEPLAEQALAAGRGSATNGTSTTGQNGEPEVVTLQPATGAKSTRDQMRAC